MFAPKCHARNDYRVSHQLLNCSLKVWLAIVYRYKTAKEELKAKIREANGKRDRVKEAMEMDSELFANVRADLLQILEISELVESSQRTKTISIFGVSISESVKYARPEHKEIEGEKTYHTEELVQALIS